MNNQPGSTVQHMNTAQCYMAAWIRRELEGELYMCIYVYELLCCALITITTF